MSRDENEEIARINADGTTYYNWPKISTLAAQWSPYCTDCVINMAKLLACCAAMCTERERDAERYRKLRAALGPGRFHSMTPRITAPFEPGQTYTPEGLDAALDALPAVGAA